MTPTAKLEELRKQANYGSGCVHADDIKALIDVAEAAVAYVDAMNNYEETAEALSTGKCGNIIMKRAAAKLSLADTRLRAALARLGGGR